MLNISIGFSVITLLNYKDLFKMVLGANAPTPLEIYKRAKAIAKAAGYPDLDVGLQIAPLKGWTLKKLRDLPPRVIISIEGPWYDREQQPGFVARAIFDKDSYKILNQIVQAFPDAYKNDLLSEQNGQKVSNLASLDLVETANLQDRRDIMLHAVTSDSEEALALDLMHVREFVQGRNQVMQPIWKVLFRKIGFKAQILPSFEQEKEIMSWLMSFLPNTHLIHVQTRDLWEAEDYISDYSFLTMQFKTVMRYIKSKKEKQKIVPVIIEILPTFPLSLKIRFFAKTFSIISEFN